MKKVKKVLALLLALVMGIGCLPASASAAETQKQWDGTVAEEFAGGNGTKEDPYLISDGAELALVAQRVNADNSTNNFYRSAWYKLTADIDLNDQKWTPIGYNSSNSTVNSYFCGTFIGGGHTISHLKIENGSNVGLFGSIASAVICDMTIRDSEIKTTGSNAAAFIGCAGMAPVINRLCNLHVVDSTVSGKHAVGGILGYAQTGSSYSASTLCCSGIKGGTITGSEYGIGGLVGWVYDARLKIDRSYCEAESIRSSAYGGAGGIVGMAATNSTITVRSQINIADCYNTAAVSTGSPIASSSHYNAAGGIVGVSRTADSSVVRCYNAGTITAGSSNSRYRSYAAGICGYSIGGSYTDCFNVGTLTTSNTSTSYKSYLSGIRYNSGTVNNSCYYGKNCFAAGTSRYYTKSTSGAEIADEAAVIEKINTTDTFTATGHWKLSEDKLPGLTGCIGSEGTCTGNCGCYCIPHETGKVTYTVTFQYHDDTTEPLICEVKDQETVEVPKAPAREGYDFLGWYIEDSDTPCDSVTVNGRDVVVNARWEQKTVTVTLATNDGNDPKEYIIAYGGSFTLPEHAPTLQGAEFIGWFDQYGNQVSGTISEIKEDMTINAEFAHFQITATRGNYGKGTLAWAMKVDDPLASEAFTVSKVGMKFIPEILLKGGELTADTSGTMNVDFAEPYGKTVMGQLTGLSQGLYDVEIAARGYAVMKNKQTQQEIVVYTNVVSVKVNDFKA